MDTIRTPTDGRWSCRACGFCCHLFKLGPVEPEIIEGLRQREVEKHWAPAASQPWMREETAPDGRSAAFLNHVDGHCVFLRPDNLCAIHGLFGAEAKPGFCREYPFHVTSDGHGAVAVVRADCSGAADSFEDGQPLTEQAPEVMDLPRVVPRKPWAPAFVQALPELRVAGAVWLDWERRLLADLDLVRADPPPPEATVSGLRATLFELGGGPAPDADPVRYVVALRAALQGLSMVLRPMVDRVPPGTSDWERSFTAEMIETIDRARARLADDWSTLDAPLATDARRYLNLTLRSQILGKSIHALGGFSEGVGAWLLDTAVARAGQPEGWDPERPLTASELGRVLSRWKKFSVNGAVQHVLRLARPALIDAFLNAD